jgi:glycerol-3-phosphate dehydrogenase (NAD(P)+)
MKHVAILGGGSFGTALADVLGRQGLDVTFWMRNAQVAEHIARLHQHPQLGAYQLPNNVHATNSLTEALRADWLVVAVPSQTLRSLLLSTSWPHVPIVLGAKGIEADTLMTCSQVVCDVLGDDRRAQTLALSGPSFAQEILLQQPTAVALACVDEILARQISKLFFCPYFRAYTTTDVIGVELGGALKNVMAIAAGGLAGLGLGDNTRAALITRGIAEITRLALACGAQERTLAGLAGVGDMILTCTGSLSRNRALGVALGQGKTTQEALALTPHVVEGVATTQSAYALARKLGMYTPIIDAVHRVIYDGLSVRDAIDEIVSRQPANE